MAEAKIHPPSRSRVAEARATGLTPRPLLVGLSAATFALAACVRLLGPSVSADLTRLLRAPLHAFAHDPVAVDLGVLRALLFPLAQKLALCAAGVLVCVGLALWLVQGAAFAWPRRSRRRFNSPKQSFEARVLAGLGVLVLCAFHLSDALFLSRAALPDFVARFLNQLAGLWLALAIIDAAFARAQFFRALWLSRSEQREEQREAYGLPELRSARAAARESLMHEEP